MNIKCNIEKKNFTDEKTGELRRYYEFNVVLDGKVIRLLLRREDKSLANYILDRIYKEN